MSFTYAIPALGLGAPSEHLQGLRSLHIAHQRQGKVTVLVYSRSALQFYERPIEPFSSISWSCKLHTVSPILIVHGTINAVVGTIGQGSGRQQSGAHYFMILKASIQCVH